MEDILGLAVYIYRHRRQLSDRLKTVFTGSELLKK